MANTMKAVLANGVGGPEVLELGEHPIPVADKNQVLIKVLATSVNRPDIVQRQGNYPPPPGDSEILGLEVAGVVEAIGSGSDAANGLQVGDKVAALVGGGGYAEYVVAHAGHCFRLPPNVSMEQGACLCETYITAFLNVIELGALAENEAVLLHGGGGGVNTAGIQIVQALRPGCTTFVTASTGKLERVAELGVDHVIDYRSSNFADEIRTITDKRGVNVILDHIGAAYLGDNLKSLALGGRLVLIGVMGGIKAEINLAMLMVKRQQILGSVLRSRPVAEKAEIIHRFVDRVIPQVENGNVVPLVSEVLPLSEVAAAHRLMEESGHFGKIVLRVGQG